MHIYYVVLALITCLYCAIAVGETKATSSHATKTEFDASSKDAGNKPGTNKITHGKHESSNEVGEAGDIEDSASGGEYDGTGHRAKNKNSTETEGATKIGNKIEGSSSSNGATENKPNKKVVSPAEGSNQNKSKSVDGSILGGEPEGKQEIEGSYLSGEESDTENSAVAGENELDYPTDDYEYETDNEEEQEEEEVDEEKIEDVEGIDTVDIFNKTDQDGASASEGEFAPAEEVSEAGDVGDAGADYDNEEEATSDYGDYGDNGEEDDENGEAGEDYGDYDETLPDNVDDKSVEKADIMGSVMGAIGSLSGLFNKGQTAGNKGGGIDEGNAPDYGQNEDLGSLGNGDSQTSDYSAYDGGADDRELPSLGGEEGANEGGFVNGNSQEIDKGIEELKDPLMSGGDLGEMAGNEEGIGKSKKGKNKSKKNKNNEKKNKMKNNNKDKNKRNKGKKNKGSKNKGNRGNKGKKGNKEINGKGSKAGRKKHIGGKNTFKCKAKMEKCPSSNVANKCRRMGKCAAKCKIICSGRKEKAGKGKKGKNEKKNKLKNNSNIVKKGAGKGKIAKMGKKTHKKQKSKASAKSQKGNKPGKKNQGKKPGKKNKTGLKRIQKPKKTKKHGAKKRSKHSLKTRTKPSIKMEGKFNVKKRSKLGSKKPKKWGNKNSGRKHILW